VLYDPALSNGGDDDRGERAGDALVAFDDRNASALMTGPAPRKLSSSYLAVDQGSDVPHPEVTRDAALLNFGENLPQ
jgi:hypothetical protein